MSDVITRGQGHLFVQTDISEPFELLTCTGVADIALPQGDLTPVYCPDIEHSGKWKIMGTITGEPALPTTTLTRPLSNVYNFLVEQSCPFNGLVAWVCEGASFTPSRFMMATVLFNMVKSDSVIETPVAYEPADQSRVLTNATLAYTDRRMVYNLQFARVAVSNTADANGVAFLDELCGSDCGGLPRDLCDYGFMGLNGTQYNSEVKYTTDGSSWAQTAADPFTYDGGDTGKPISFELSATTRVIVPRISTAHGEYAEVAYTEDDGDTWTNIYVGTMADQWLTRLRKRYGKVWATASAGYIYMSDDMCETWETQSNGDATGELLRDIVMYSDRVGYAVGNDNAFLYTLDGSTWAAGVGPAAGVDLHTVSVNSSGHIFVGAADGVLYVSRDGGDTWEEGRNFGAGIVSRVEFDESLHYFGVLIYNTPAPVGTVYRSFDGGATWFAPAGQTATWNSGLNDLFICDQNNIVVVGNAHGGTTFVANAVPVS